MSMSHDSRRVTKSRLTRHPDHRTAPHHVPLHTRARVTSCVMHKIETAHLFTWNCRTRRPCPHPLACRQRIDPSGFRLRSTSRMQKHAIRRAIHGCGRWKPECRPLLSDFRRRCSYGLTREVGERRASLKVRSVWIGPTSTPKNRDPERPRQSQSRCQNECGSPAWG